MEDDSKLAAEAILCSDIVWDLCRVVNKDDVVVSGKTKKIPTYMCCKLGCTKVTKCACGLTNHVSHLLVCYGGKANLHAFHKQEMLAKANSAGGRQASVAHMVTPHVNQYDRGEYRMIICVLLLSP
jgi:hypothetical protein